MTSFCIHPHSRGCASCGLLRTHRAEPRRIRALMFQNIKIAEHRCAGIVRSQNITPFSLRPVLSTLHKLPRLRTAKAGAGEKPRLHTQTTYAIMENDVAVF